MVRWRGLGREAGVEDLVSTPGELDNLTGLGVEECQDLTTLWKGRSGCCVGSRG